MPVPLKDDSAGLNLSSRFQFTTAVVASPAAAAETIIAQLNLNTDETIVSGISIRGWAAFTVGTTGTAVTFRIRRTNVAGALVVASGALTGGVAAGNLLAQDIYGFDTGAAVTGQIYVMTMQVTGGSAASTVSA